MLGTVIKDIFRSFRPVSNSPVEMQPASEALRTVQREGGSILCFTSGSEGNALAELTRQIIEPFKDKASRIVIFDLTQQGWQPELENVLAEPVWFAAAFFGAGQEMTLPKDGVPINLWESAGIPFVRFFGDTPAYFPDSHVQKYRNSVNGYFHCSQASFYRRWFRDPGLSVVLPPLMLDSMPLENVNVAKKLNGKIIFPKNGNSPERLINYWRTSLPPLLSKALESLAEESVSKEWIDRELCLDDKLLRYFAEKGTDIAADRVMLCFLVAQLDDYVRRVKSTMVAESLLDLPVVIRGRFWEHVNFNNKRATYDPDSDVVRTLALIDQAPALVDMSPNTQHAPHDRICRAVGRGTAFLTNRQTFLDTRFSEPERFCFSFERDAIRACVERYIDSPQEAVELGLEQARVLREHFRDEDFVESLATAVQICSVKLNGRPSNTQNFVVFPPRLFR